jgi:uncharacterized protein (UPF0335 family)
MTIGHNSVAGELLRSIVDRVEHLEVQKRIIADDIKYVYAEAKGSGFNVKALRAIVQRRKRDVEELMEHEALVEFYRKALGDFANTDLGQADIDRAANK